MRPETIHLVTEQFQGYTGYKCLGFPIMARKKKNKGGGGGGKTGGGDSSLAQASSNAESSAPVADETAISKEHIFTEGVTSFILLRRVSQRSFGAESAQL